MLESQLKTAGHNTVLLIRLSHEVNINVYKIHATI